MCVGDVFILYSTWLLGLQLILFNDTLHPGFSVHGHSMLHAPCVLLVLMAMPDSCLEEWRVKLLVFPLSALLLSVTLILRRLNLVYLRAVEGFVERGVGRTGPGVWSVSSN